MDVSARRNLVLGFLRTQTPCLGDERGDVVDLAAAGAGQMPFQ